MKEATEKQYIAHRITPIQQYDNMQQYDSKFLIRNHGDQKEVAQHFSNAERKKCQL